MCEGGLKEESFSSQLAPSRDLQINTARPAMRPPMHQVKAIFRGFQGILREKRELKRFSASPEGLAPEEATKSNLSHLSEQFPK